MDIRARTAVPCFDSDDREALDRLAAGLVTALAFVFLGLIVLELAVPLSPAWSRRVELASYLIWAVFLVDFTVRFVLAEDRVAYLRANWLSALAVALPAFRVLRAARALRVARGLRVARLVTTTSRGARALQRVMGAGGVGYVLAFTVVVVLVAGAGVPSLERGEPGARITSFGEGLWWAATTVTTLGSPAYPVTPEGRVLGLLVMVYGLAVSGYVTAVLAVFLLGLRREQDQDPGLAALREDIERLRAELREARPSVDGAVSGPPAARSHPRH